MVYFSLQDHTFHGKNGITLDFNRSNLHASFFLAVASCVCVVIAIFTVSMAIQKSWTEYAQIDHRDSDSSTTSIAKHLIKRYRKEDPHGINSSNSNRVFPTNETILVLRDERQAESESSDSSDWCDPIPPFAATTKHTRQEHEQISPQTTNTLDGIVTHANGDKRVDRITVHSRVNMHDSEKGIVKRVKNDTHNEATFLLSSKVEANSSDDQEIRFGTSSSGLSSLETADHPPPLCVSVGHNLKTLRRSDSSEKCVTIAGLSTKRSTSGIQPSTTEQPKLIRSKTGLPTRKLAHQLEMKHRLAMKGRLRKRRNMTNEQRDHEEMLLQRTRTLINIYTTRPYARISAMGAIPRPKPLVHGVGKYARPSSQMMASGTKFMASFKAYRAMRSDWDKQNKHN